MIRTLGMLSGALFLLGGILGFVPGITEDDMFLGIFMVNTPHNIVHIASGAVFIIASASGARAARLWFQVFGIAYAAVAAMGFYVGDGMIFGLITNNRYDSWGHTALALVLLMIGFAVPRNAAASFRSVGPALIERCIDGSGRCDTTP